MNESIFDIEVKDQRLYGVWHHANSTRLSFRRDEALKEEQSSEEYMPKKKAVVFLHGWGGYRTGPHDMLVKLARCIARLGYHCFRFDFRGKGYSQGERELAGNRSMLEDLEAVLCFVDKTLNHPQITLAGICSGARLALFYVRSRIHPIAHVIALSSPVLREEEVKSVMIVNQTKHTLYLYASKLFRQNTWLKLVNGEIHFRSVWYNVVHPLSCFYLSLKRYLLDCPAVKERRRSEESELFVGLYGQVLLIHAEKDPETQPALLQICEMLKRHAISYDLHVVKNANHSFYASHWEKEIIEVIENWLVSR